MVNISDWAEMHCEILDDFDSDDTGIDITEGELEISQSLSYAYKAEVHTYRNIPSLVELIELVRIEIDEDGDVIDRTEVPAFDYPEYICKAIEKKILEMQ